MCAALEFSHRHGIIHRDIKPGNVMLTQTGQVKVMDFGIARALASGATTMTQTSAVIGTAQYLSPEQARGEAVDARSDVYAAGCVLFELICGHPPFVGDSPVSVAYQHVREAPPTPSDINPDVNPAVDAIVLKALSKNPLNRYQSAGEMRADLLRAAAGRPVLATPVLPQDETTRVVPAGAGYPAPPGAPQTRQIPARVGDPRRRKASSWLIATFAAVGVLAVIALAAALLNQGDDEVAVPTVTGLTQQEAFARITQANLVPREGEQHFDATCKKGQVVNQTPVGNSTLEPNGEVVVQVCGGPATKLIPTSLDGATYENAKQQLEAAGFKVKKVEKDSADQEGIVLGVSPAEGTRVAEGAEVTLTVSKGNVSRVPNVVNSTVEDARKELRDAGYDVDVEQGREVPAAEAGRVLSQNPRAGTNLAKGKTVTIVVSVPQAEPTPSDTPSPTPSTTPSGEGGGFPLPTTPPMRLPEQ
jgi:serine/threonine-protein kinase